ncbi:spore coat protein D [Desulfosporosinus fructosivorans]
MHSCVRPICCPPQYCVQDFYTQRFVPVIHPIVTINRQNIIDVPQHIYQRAERTVVVNQGFQGQVQGQGADFLAAQGTQGFTNRLFR